MLGAAALVPACQGEADAPGPSGGAGARDGGTDAPTGGRDAGGGGGTSGSGGGGLGGAGGATPDAAAGADAGTADARADGPDPCARVLCNQPPTNECASASDLRVYSLLGACDDGGCSYASALVPCEFGCAAGACGGDPCLGVTCQSPPANLCSDATHLTVYDVPGACAGGSCTYSSHEEYCAAGCASGVCNGDPCIGMQCTSPPASYCQDTSTLVVHDTPGACVGGACQYVSRTEHCAFGCSAGICSGDPCVGVSCAAPPGNYCVGPNTLRVSSSPGACAGGLCTYPSTDVTCPYGCANGVCQSCATSVDCGAGSWCDAGTCRTCDSTAHCGSACTDCAAAGRICNAAGTACTDCAVDADCGSGRWCNAGACENCNLPAHCGPSCVACSGVTPLCGVGACMCSPSSCATNQQCVSGACSVCKSDTACGSSCTACGGSTPRCLDQGATSTCVACVADTDCTGGFVCGTNHTCVAPGCPPPAESCTTGTQSRDRCTGARVIGRVAAATTAGYSISDDTCDANDRFDDSSGCWDANNDHAYRIYLRKNESAAITLTTSWPCPSSSYSYWYATLQVFSNAGCSDTTCATKIHCDYNDDQHDYTLVAPQDGWYVIVVDGSSAFDDYGDYTLKVKLTCAQAGCEC